MIIETNQVRPWGRVAKPLPKFSSEPGPRVVSKPPAPPVSPKPGGKVYLYAYGRDKESTTAQPQYFHNPHFIKQVSLEQEIPFSYSNEKAAREQKDAQSATRQRSGRQRVRDQGRKSQKGYKVLADVTPNLRSSSRGGRMFIKQKHRMEKYTKESQNQEEEEEDAQIYGNREEMTEGASDTWASPWNLASKSPSAVKYITTKPMVGPMNKSSLRLLDPLGFLPKPPDFWRAKVEQHFPNNGPTHQPGFQFTSAQRQNISQRAYDRPDSAPPMESPTYYDGKEDATYNSGAIYDENEDCYIASGLPPRPASAALQSATIHFNAKQYYEAPQRRQGLRRGWSVYSTTPHAHRDFNARPKGWRRHY